MYSQAVKEPVDLRKIILDQKNEEKSSRRRKRKEKEKFQKKGETLEDINIYI